MSNVESPTGHRFGRPRLLAADGPYENTDSSQVFQPLPPPTGVAPYHLELASVLGQPAVDAIVQAGSMTFHMVGDTGGISNPLPQQDVAAALEADLASSAAGWTPSFLYVLGDCVYFNGQESLYYPQLYEPYAHYTAPILAVPGNHDGDPIDASQTTLDGFVANFCTTTPTVNSAAGDTGRTTMTQPYVYWTLDSPLLTIIGMYTNVPEYGEIDATPFPGMSGVTMEAADDHHYGYARVQVTAAALSLQAVSVAPSPGVATTAITPTVIDEVTIPLRLGR
jgi:hypothetical protein